MRIGAGDVGARVVVRHRLPGGSATDVVGVLLEARGRFVAVRDARGAVVRVAASDVVASRVVGQPRARGSLGGHPTATAGDVMSTSVADAASVTALGWQGRSVEPLGDWLLRSGPGVMLRGRSALVTGDPGVALPRALDAVVDHYAGLGLAPAVQVSSALLAAPAPDDHTLRLEGLLAASGWSPQPWTVLAVRAPAASTSTTGTAPTATTPTVDLDASPDARWLAASDHHGAALTRADLPPERDGTAVVYATASEPGTSRATGVARGALARHWLGVTCVTVDPAHRRRGVARALLSSLEDGLGGEAEALYVQVVADNAGARATWRALGFTDHSRYRFWTLPGAPG